MHKNKSSVSNASSYKEIGEYWDKHDLTEIWDQTKPVEFSVNIQSELRYYAIEPELSGKIKKIANQKGTSPEKLINIWLKERVGTFELEKKSK